MAKKLFSTRIDEKLIEQLKIASIRAKSRYQEFIALVLKKGLEALKK